jgi:tetratricopeptide (TPR) repeat protein
MSRGRKSPPPEAVPRARRFALGPRLLALLIAGAAVAAIVMFWRRPAPDPLGNLSEAAASDSANAMFESNRFTDALPYFRRLERLGPQNSYLFHARFAATLQNAAVEARNRDGIDLARSGSSADRIGLVRDALAEMDRAELLAPGAEQRGDVASSRAWLLGLWGFWRESDLEFRRANQIRPLIPEERVEAMWVEAMLLDPTRTAPAPLTR